MGYPMTYRRVVNRNRIAEGGYGADAYKQTIAIAPGHESEAVYKVLAESAYERLDEHRHRWNMLLGDLRRLEADTVDESATATYIARRTGIDPEIVAAVLKEFMSW